MGVKVINNISKFIDRSYKSMDRALNRMVIDVERLSKMQVPHDKGQLKASGHHERKGFLLYQIVYNKAYALYQEFGGDGKKKVVRKYSKAGKKKFYLRDPGRLIASKAMSYFRSEALT